MTDEIVVRGGPVDAIERQTPAKRLVDAFFRARKPNTLAAYRRDIADFARFLKVADGQAAAEVLLSSKPGRANELALGFRDSLVERDLKPATVNRRLAAVRSLVKLARVLGMVTWSIEIEGLENEPYRDTLGPGQAAVAAMLRQTGDGATGIRNRFLVRALHDMGLRRGELCELDRLHYDRDGGRLHIFGKGRRYREWVTMPAETLAALEAWLDVRGDEPGPLLIALDGANYGHRLTGSAVYGIIRKLGRRVGVKTRPHGLRHTAISTALEVTKDPRAVQRFSRHKSLETLVRYDDNRSDASGRVASVVAIPEGARTTREAAQEAAQAVARRARGKPWFVEAIVAPDDEEGFLVLLRTRQRVELKTERVRGVRVVAVVAGGAP